MPLFVIKAAFSAILLSQLSLSMPKNLVPSIGVGV